MPVACIKAVSNRPARIAFNVLTGGMSSRKLTRRWNISSLASGRLASRRYSPSCLWTRTERPSIKWTSHWARGPRTTRLANATMATEASPQSLPMMTQRTDKRSWAADGRNDET